jgi:hypothetical protein
MMPHRSTMMMMMMTTTIETTTENVNRLAAVICANCHLRSRVGKPLSGLVL